MYIYYIYAYLREDGTPYYIGKGKGNRAFATSRAIPKPPKDRIVIMETNLTEIGALALERFYIRWHGRKDLGAGTLRNMTDGGDGTSGHIVTEETRKKISSYNKGKVKSEEHKKKIGQSNKGKKHEYLSLLNISRKGIPRSEETKRKIGETRKGKKYPRTIPLHENDALLPVKTHYSNHPIE